MNKFAFFITWIVSISVCYAQGEKDPLIEIKDLGFIEGKWKAVAKDSSFHSILEYKFSPEGRLLMSTNHLYGGNGQLFGVYEGAYILEGEKLIFFLSGPNGEIHKGSAEIKNDTLVHRAILYPGNGTKSYKSEMVLNNDQLFYYANYSKEEAYPDKVDHSSPLVYDRLGE